MAVVKCCCGELGPLVNSARYVLLRFVADVLGYVGVRELKLRGAIKLQLLVALFLGRSKLWPRWGLSRCGVVTIDKLVAEWVGVWIN